jgi:hypothetical protein
MVWTAQAAFLVAAEPQRHAAMRAEFVDEAEASLRIAECHHALAEAFHAHRRAIALGQLPRQQHGQPIAAKQVSHRRAGAGAHQQFVVFSFHRGILSAGQGVLLGGTSFLPVVSKVALR